MTCFCSNFFRHWRRREDCTTDLINPNKVAEEQASCQLWNYCPFDALNMEMRGYSFELNCWLWNLLEILVNVWISLLDDTFYICCVTGRITVFILNQRLENYSDILEVLVSLVQQKEVFRFGLVPQNVGRHIVEDCIWFSNQCFLH